MGSSYFFLIKISDNLKKIHGYTYKLRYHSFFPSIYIPGDLTYIILLVPKVHRLNWERQIYLEKGIFYIFIKQMDLKKKEVI